MDNATWCSFYNDSAGIIVVGTILHFIYIIHILLKIKNLI